MAAIFVNLEASRMFSSLASNASAKAGASGILESAVRELSIQSELSDRPYVTPEECRDIAARFKGLVGLHGCAICPRGLLQLAGLGLRRVWLLMTQETSPQETSRILDMFPSLRDLIVLGLRGGAHMSVASFVESLPTHPLEMLTVKLPLTPMIENDPSPIGSARRAREVLLSAQSPGVHDLLLESLKGVSQVTCKGFLRVHPPLSAEVFGLSTFGVSLSAACPVLTTLSVVVPPDLAALRKLCPNLQNLKIDVCTSEFVRALYSSEDPSPVHLSIGHMDCIDLSWLRGRCHGLVVCSEFVLVPAVGMEGLRAMHVTANKLVIDEPNAVHAGLTAAILWHQGPAATSVASWEAWKDASRLELACPIEEHRSCVQMMASVVGAGYVRVTPMDTDVPINTGIVFDTLPSMPPDTLLREGFVARAHFKSPTTNEDSYHQLAITAELPGDPRPLRTEGA